MRRFTGVVVLGFVALFVSWSWLEVSRPRPELLEWRTGGRWNPCEGWNKEEWCELAQPDGGVIWTQSRPFVIQTAGEGRGSRIVVFREDIEQALFVRAAQSADLRRVAFAFTSMDGAHLGLVASEDGFGTAVLAAWLPVPVLSHSAGMRLVQLIDSGWRIEFVNGERAPLDREYWSPWDIVKSHVWPGFTPPELPVGLFVFESKDLGRTWTGPHFAGPIP